MGVGGWVTNPKNGAGAPTYYSIISQNISGYAAAILVISMLYLTSIASALNF